MKLMTIPECREALLDLADDLDTPGYVARRIRGIVYPHMVRRSAIRKTRAIYPKLTPEQAQAVRDYKKAHPRVGYTKMAQIFNTNIGRISEALTGKRGDGDVPEVTWGPLSEINRAEDLEAEMMARLRKATTR